MIKFNDKEFIIAIILAIFSSLLSGAFFIISLKGLEISNGIVFFTILSIFEFIIMGFYILIKNDKIILPHKRYILNSFFYSVATILFFTIINKTNIIILSEIITLNILIFISFQLLHHKNVVNKKMILKLIIGGVIVIVAILVIYGFNKTSLNEDIIIIAIIVTLFYSISNYLFSHDSKHSHNKTNFIFWLIFFQVLIGLTITTIFNMNVKLNMNVIIYSLLAGVFLFLSTIIMIYSYHRIKNFSNVSRLIGTSILFILGETSTIFISLLYGIFIGSLNIYIIISIILLIVAIYIISSVEEKIK